MTVLSGCFRAALSARQQRRSRRNGRIWWLTALSPVSLKCQCGVMVCLLCFSDGVVRVFSSSPERQAAEEEQKEWQDLVANSSIPSQSIVSVWC